jgi:hypothetical protein
MPGLFFRQTYGLAARSYLVAIPISPVRQSLV